MLPFPTGGTKLGRRWFERHRAPDKSISAQQTEMRVRQPAIVDLASTSGTFVNGVQLRPDDSPTPLNDGAVIRMGRTILVCRDSYKGPSEPMSPLLLIPLHGSSWPLESVHLSFPS